MALRHVLFRCRHRIWSENNRYLEWRALLWFERLLYIKLLPLCNHRRSADEE